MDDEGYSMIARWLFKWFSIFFGILLALWIFGKVSFPDYKPQSPSERNAVSGFRNYDPSRPATDIKSVDYENKVIHYYEYNDPGAVSGVKASGRYGLPVQDSPVYDNSASGGTNLRLDDGSVVHIDLPPDVAIQQLMDDVDYNDLLDYYGSPEFL